MNVQIIERSGQPEYAVLPYAEYLKLTEAAETALDTAVYNEALAVDEELVSHVVVKQLVAGVASLKIWREYRGLTQAATGQHDPSSDC